MTASLMPPLSGSRLAHLLREYLPAPQEDRLGAALVLDGDRTLAPQDTGRIIGRALGVDDRIRSAFVSHGYTDDSFGIVADIWSTIPLVAYQQRIRSVAETVTLHAFWIKVLREVARRVPVVVISAGVPQVWRLVLDMHDLPSVPVLGGCHRALDSYVVSPATKAELVVTLRADGWSVVAAGDSVIDLPMLKAADVPLFVPDAKGSPGLRPYLHEVPSVRHAAVDDRRFEPLPWCTAEQVVRMVLDGGRWDAG